MVAISPVVALPVAASVPSRAIAPPAAPAVKPAAALAPITEQLDPKLGITVLDLNGIDPDISTSVPSQKQLEAYALPDGGRPKGASSVA